MNILKLLAVLPFVACLSNKHTSDVPNFYQVRAGVWRSGQPTTDEQWRALYAIGVREVVKLNFANEGSDDGALRAGMIVHTLSIEPRGDEDVWDNLKNTLMQPDAALVEQAEEIIERGGGVLVHCTYGRDRTGEIIGISRLRVERWDKAKAWAEMIQRGYRPELLGLTWFWQHYHVEGTE